MVYRVACRFFGCREIWDEGSVQRSQRVKIGKIIGDTSLPDVLRQVYDIGEDDRRLRRLAFQENPLAYFATLRNGYYFRHGFQSVTLEHHGQLSADYRGLLQSLGFGLIELARS
jgi:hypothetical protein